MPGSAADQAGPKAGPTTVKVGNQAVNSFADLVAQISANTPGSKITLTVADASGGNQRDVEVTLGSEQDKATKTANDAGTQQQRPFPWSNGRLQGGR